MLLRVCLAASLAVGLAVLAFSPPASARNNTARGAVIGGATGAVIGGAVTGTGRGALIGGAVGAGTGAVIGNNRSRRNVRSYYFRRGNSCYFRDRNGRTVRVDRRRCR